MTLADYQNYLTKENIDGCTKLYLIETFLKYPKKSDKSSHTCQIYIAAL